MLKGKKAAKIKGLVEKGETMVGAGRDHRGQGETTVQS